MSITTYKLQDIIEVEAERVGHDSTMKVRMALSTEILKDGTIKSGVRFYFAPESPDIQISYTTWHEIQQRLLEMEATLCAPSNMDAISGQIMQELVAKNGSSSAVIHPEGIKDNDLPF